MDRIGGIAVGAFNQTDRVHQKGSDDGWVQAFVIQDQNRVIEAWLGIHDIATRRGFALDIAHVGSHISQPVHAWQVMVAKRSDGAPEMIKLQAGGMRSFHGK